MTALDLTCLLYKRGALTHARDILKVLCGEADYIDNQYLFRFPLPQFTSGKTEKVFTLGSRGRDYLVREVGVPVNWYFRPSQVRHLGHRWSYQGYPVVATNHLYREAPRAELGAVWKEFLAWKRQVEPTLAEEDRLFKTGINGRTVWVIDDGTGYTLMYPEDY